MFKFIRKVVIYLFVAHLVYIVVLKWINPPFTITQVQQGFEQGKFKRDYISYEEMGRNIKLAVIGSEDQKFPVHNGFDMDGIQEAIEKNKEGKKLKR